MTKPVTLDKKIVYVTGLPRSGSTLLCQLLGTHNKIYSPQHSSPLGPTLNQLRHNLSDNPFFLAQLDVDFDLVYQRLFNAYRGFINGWFAESDQKVVVDKNRMWLRLIETVDALDPDFQMIVCVRDLRQIFGSVQAQHRKTLLIDDVDHMAAGSDYQRADKLFGDDGVIGAPLRSIQYLQDLPERFRNRVAYVEFNSLVVNPVGTMNVLYEWLGLKKHLFDPNDLPTRSHESDSYYRFKFRHETRPAIVAPSTHEIPERVETEILSNFRWYYELYYPEALDTPAE